LAAILHLLGEIRAGFPDRARTHQAKNGFQQLNNAPKNKDENTSNMEESAELLLNIYVWDSNILSKISTHGAIQPI
jgi:hypothetical protein